nr:PTS mannose transporter subunit IIA [Enterococcus durans]
MELIYGTHHSITALDCYMSESFDLSKSVKQLIEEYKGKELIILTDLFGGSVNNEFLQYIDQPNIHLIAGLNLPLLIEIVTQVEMVDSITGLIQRALRESKETIQFCNESIKTKVEEEEF